MSLSIVVEPDDKEVTEDLDQTFSNFIIDSHLDTVSGSIDVYLYFLNEKLNLNTEVILGGEIELSAEEYIIKYAYGYHKTKYGQMFLKQKGMTNEEFMDGALDSVKEYFDQYFSGNLLHNIRIALGESDWWDAKEKNIVEFLEGLVPSSYISIQEDGFIIKYEDLWRDFRSKLKAETKLESEIIDKIDAELFSKASLEVFRQILGECKVTDAGDIIRITFMKHHD